MVVTSRWALGEENLARHPSLRWKKAHDGQGRNRFAGTGFTDKAQNFAGGDGEAEVADRRKGWCGNRRPRLSRRPGDGSGKLNAEVSDVEKRGHDLMVAARQSLRPV